MDGKPAISMWLFREKLWAVAVIAIAVANWLAFEAKWISDRHRAIDELQHRVDFEIERTCSRAPVRMYVDGKTGQLVHFEKEVVQPHWNVLGSCLLLFGEPSVEKITYRSPQDAGLERRLRFLFPEAAIWLCPTRTDLYVPPVIERAANPPHDSPASPATLY